MGAGFETSDAHANERLRPLRVPIRAEHVFESAREMAADLPGWEVVSCDSARRVLVCRRRGGLLSGTATITIACEGPEDVPTTTVRVRSVSAGGLLARDRARVLEFLEPFHRRVC
jgi:hypothetical protein